MWASDEVPKNLANWDMGRAKEKYNPLTSQLRSRVNTDNRFGVFLLYRPYEGKFAKFINDFLRRAHNHGKCVICGCLLFSFITFLISAGDALLVNNAMVYLFLTTRTILSEVTSPQSLDTAKIRFHADIRHIQCMSKKSLLHIVQSTFQEQTLFADFIYFHPNVGLDGWSTFCEYYNQVRTQMTDEPTLLPHPPSPKFWHYSERGSRFNRWPPTPSFFDDWIEMVRNGEVLRLDGDTTPLSHHLLAPPSSINSLNNMPGPSSRPYNPSPPSMNVDPDIFPSTSHDSNGRILKSPPAEEQLGDEDSGSYGFADIDPDALEDLP